MAVKKRLTPQLSLPTKTKNQAPIHYHLIQPVVSLPIDTEWETELSLSLSLHIADVLIIPSAKRSNRIYGIFVRAKAILVNDLSPVSGIDASSILSRVVTILPSR